VHGLAKHPDAEVVGIWDDNIERGEDFAQKSGLPFVGYADDLLAIVDAVVICSENVSHVAHIEMAARAGKHILCEKPVGVSASDFDRMSKAVNDAGVRFMTAFPCRFTPAYRRLRERLKSGEIGEIRGVCATNRGSCPFSWFVEKELSGGGAMIDHVVHVADLLNDLFRVAPISVDAQIGNRMYGQEWEDSALVSIEYPGGIIATIDSSWSRPKGFRTWGDVMISFVGTKGVMELDLFSADVHRYGVEGHSVGSFGSDADAQMIDEFVQACLSGRETEVTLADGIAAAQVAVRAYASLHA
jgi:predicted dehydrogenase